MVYFLEDDDTIRNFVIYALTNSGIETKGFEKPSLFYEAVKSEVPDLVLLDRMLPEEDGMVVLSKIRTNSNTEAVPVIMLTALGSEYDKVVGLDGGADDYLTKPFGTMELVSRVKAMLRRYKPSKDKCDYRIGNLFISTDKHIVKVNGENIILTLKEFELLTLLVKNKGVVFSRDQILKHIWGYEFDGENRTVDVHVRTLRNKLKSCGDLVVTVRGIGYKIGENND